MDIMEGYFYHIKDSFFADVADDKLMANKEDGSYRESQGAPLTLHESTRRAIIGALRHNLRLHARGINLFFADITRIYRLMIEHLAPKEGASDG